MTLTHGFWTLETEVTQELWESVTGSNPSERQGADLPVENVSWNDCLDFVNKLNELCSLSDEMEFRIPTEAEWEYACRAGSTTLFSCGDRLTSAEANCNGARPYGTNEEGQYLGETTPVKSYAPNAWGLYDMHGNVWEWCDDWYGGCFSGESETDPRGAQSSASRVGRGGSWDCYALACRLANRNYEDPSFRAHDLGLRLVLSSK